MRCKLYVSCLALFLIQLPLAAQLRVSDNHRFLVHAKSGEPFFWLGDTAWELFHRLNREDATYYLQNRAAKGFTVIQAVAIAELDGVREPNANGDLPFQNENPLQPNEPYWRHIDFIVKKANELGLHIGLLPTWGDKWNKAWGLGPVLFNPSNAEAYGEWIGRRYRDTAGLIWILGGDRNVETDEHRAIVRAMARGIRRGDGGAHLMTFHPTGGRGSAEAFHNDDWLDFNMRQNGHTAEFTGRYDKTRADYDRQPAKPVLDGEPIYEDHPVNFKADQFGHSIASDVRRPLYWDLFTGAFGHTYGHHSVWQMWTPTKHKPINNPLLDWKSALDQPGAAQMQYARWLLESRPFLDRIPDDDSVIVPDPAIPTHIPGAGRYRFVATRDRARTYAMIYAPVGRKFKVRLNSIAAANVRTWWYDPRTGKSTQIGTFPTSEGEKEFTPPNTGEMQDWVLVLDDASKNYAAPGVRPK
jgi:hypothetical protein